MGSNVDRTLKGLSTFGFSEVDRAGVVGTGKSAAVRAQKAQKKAIEEQAKREKLRLAEATSEVETRRAAGGKARKGRQSLIATNPTGLATKLGGGE